MNHIKAYFDRKLDAPFPQFKALLQRLLNTGVLARAESTVELELYDVFIRCKDEVEDYLSLLDIQVVHDPDAHFVRLAPPGSEVPGVESEFSARSSAFRQTLSQEEIDVLLVLRVQYENGLRSGELNEHGDVIQTYEGFSLALYNILGRRLAITVTERKHLFRRLRQLRTVSLNLDDLDDLSGWFTIRPVICSYVSEQVLDELASELDESASELDESASVMAKEAALFDIKTDQDDQNTSLKNLTKVSVGDIQRDSNGDQAGPASAVNQQLMSNDDHKSLFGEAD